LLSRVFFECAALLSLSIFYKGDIIVSGITLTGSFLCQTATWCWISIKKIQYILCAKWMKFHLPMSSHFPWEREEIFEASSSCVSIFFTALGSYSWHYLIFGKLDQLLQHANNFIVAMVMHHKRFESSSSSTISKPA